MVILKAKGEQTTSVERQAEGAEVYVKALRDGTLTVADWIGALSLEGRVFTANAGTQTSALAFGTGAMDTGEFDLHVAVPSSVVIVPLELRVVFQAFGGTAGLVEVAMISGGGGTCGAASAITPVSSSISSGRVSACTVNSISTTTSGVYTTTNVKEIYRDSRQLAITISSVAQLREQEVFTWNAMDSGILDVVGPTQQLQIFAASYVGTGMIALKYAELPLSAIE